MQRRLPWRTNMQIATAIIAAHGYVLVILPAFLLPLSLLWILTLVPLMWLPITHWALIHEAIHKHLHPSTRINDYTARVLSVFMGASFHILRFGHLMHHKLNRSWQSELVKEDTALAKANYYFTLMGGLYISEILGSIAMSLLPRRAFLWLTNKGSLTSHPDIRTAGERFFYVKTNAAHVRVDTACIFLLYGISFLLYQEAYGFLLLFIGTRAFIVSFMDNIYHYGTASDNSQAGKDLELPAFAQRLLLNSNYHDTHHRNPQVAWVYLPHMHRRQHRAFTGDFIRHGLSQFRGPIKR